MGRAAITVLVLAALGGLGWFVYDRNSFSDTSEAPLIRADAGPIKIRPEDPGGLAVPYRNKLIYQTLDGSAVEETVERLLPAPEEPLPPPEPPQPVVVAQEPAATQESSLPALPPAEIVAPTEASPEASIEVEPQSTEAEAPPEPMPAPAPPPPELAITEAPVPATPAEGADIYMVQIASFRTIDDAEGAWRKAIKNNSDLLSAHSAQVVRADLGGDKGVYYRLRVGPFAEGEAAKSLCAKLKARNVDCLVVRR